jgi:hypothetical protein
MSANMNDGGKNEQLGEVKARCFCPEEYRVRMSLIREIGWREGRVDMAVKLLELRFGPLPESAHKQLAGAFTAQLDKAIGDMLMAGSLTVALRSLA